MNKQIISLVGFVGSGKGVAATFLEERGFVLYAGRDIIRQEAARTNVEPTRENLIAIGNRMREEAGGAVLMKGVVPLLDQISNDPTKTGIVADSIRNPEEVKLLQSLGSLILEVLAPPRVRFERLLERKKLGDPTNWYEFVGLEAIDHGYGQETTGQNIAGCVELADAVLYNDTSVQILESGLDTILAARGLIEGAGKRERF